MFDEHRASMDGAQPGPPKIRVVAARSAGSVFGSVAHASIPRVVAVLLHRTQRLRVLNDLLLGVDRCGASAVVY